MLTARAAFEQALGVDRVTVNDRPCPFASQAAAAGRNWEKSAEHYQIASAKPTRSRSRASNPRCAAGNAQMLLERDGPGDRAKAGTMLDEAIASYREIGMPRHVEMAEDMRAKL